MDANIVPRAFSVGLVLVVALASPGRTAPRSLQRQRAEVTASRGSRTTLVDCAAGETVGDALAQAATTVGRLTITIIGLCTERVVITRDDTTLQGANPGDGLMSPQPQVSAALVRVDGAQRTVLQQLTLKPVAPDDGVELDQGAVLTASGLVIDDAQHALLLGQGTIAEVEDSEFTHSHASQVIVQSGHLRLSSSTISNGAFMGVSVLGGGTLELGQSTLQGNAYWGLSVAGNASATVLDGTDIEQNEVGVVAATGGTVSITSSSTVGNNRQDGIRVSDGSRLTLGGGVIVENNAGHGVFVTGGSLVGAFEANISNNQGSGIYLTDTSIAGGGPQFDIPIIGGNAGWGVFCEAPPAVAQVRRPGFPAETVSGNTAGETNCPPLGIPDRIP
jgi:hypothetical protein